MQIKPPDPHQFVQHFNIVESGRVVIPAHWWTPATWFLIVVLAVICVFILLRKWSRKDKLVFLSVAFSFFALFFPQSLQTKGEAHIAFQREIRKPIYLVIDYTDPKADVFVIDESYLHASSVVLKGKPSHVVWYQVAER